MSQCEHATPIREQEMGADPSLDPWSLPGKTVPG